MTIRSGLSAVVYDDEFYCQNLLAVGLFFGSLLLNCLFMSVRCCVLFCSVLCFWDRG